MNIIMAEALKKCVLAMVHTPVINLLALCVA